MEIVTVLAEPMSFSLAYGIEGANTLKIIVSWFVDDKNLIVLAKTQKLGRGASWRIFLRMANRRIYIRLKKRYDKWDGPP